MRFLINVFFQCYFNSTFTISKAIIIYYIYVNVAWLLRALMDARAELERRKSPWKRGGQLNCQTAKRRLSLLFSLISGNVKFSLCFKAKRLNYYIFDSNWKNKEFNFY